MFIRLSDAGEHGVILSQENRLMVAGLESSKQCLHEW